MAQCITPFLVKQKLSNSQIPVPCNKCPACLARRVSAWSFRLMQEEKVCTNCFFLTLTYDTAKVPITKNGFMSLSKRDCQLFLKRLRKGHWSNNYDGAPVKYYLVGEYGGKTRRPHYHCLIYNVKLDLVQGAWNNGQIHYGKVSGASVGYTLKYMNKPPFRHHVNDDRQPVFALMSKGLGKAYLTPRMCDYHRGDLLNNVCCVLEGGKKVSMPRYYKDKIYSDEDRLVISGYFKRKFDHDLTKAIEASDSYFRDTAENDLAAFRKMDRFRDHGTKL